MFLFTQLDFFIIYLSFFQKYLKKTVTWHEWLKCAGCKVRQSIFRFDWVIQSVAERSVFPCRDTLIGPVRSQRLCSIKKTTTKEYTFCCSIKCLTHSWHKQQMIFRYFFLSKPLLRIPDTQEEIPLWKKRELVSLLAA